MAGLSNIQKTLCDVLLNDGLEECTHDAIFLVFMMRVFILPIYQLMASPGSLFIYQNEKMNVLDVKVMCIYLFTDECA
jgi:hypothetical protein